MSKLTSIFLALFFLAFAACDLGKAERPLVAGGYNLQISFLAGARTVDAYHRIKPERLPAAARSNALQLIGRLSDGAQALSKAIDATIEINPQTKVGLLGEVDRYLALIDAQSLLFVSDAGTQMQIARWIRTARLVAMSVKIGIANINVPTPTIAAKAKFQKAAEKVAADNARGIEESDVQLVEELTKIAGDFTADLLAQKGLDAAALRQLRDAKHVAVQAATQPAGR